MSFRSLSAENEKNSHYLSLFRSGHERGLNYFYQKSYSSLLWVGKELINDEFLVSCTLHECYLSVWAYREKIESLSHAYRFTRMNLRWQVLKEIRKPSYQIYRQKVFIDHFERTFGELEDFVEPSEVEGRQKRKDELVKVIAYLPGKTQLIATLHFVDGLSQRQIADRLSCHTLHVSFEIEKSIELIRRMVRTNSRERPISRMNEAGFTPGSDVLSPQQARVYALKQERKMSFAGIARELGWCQNQVQQYYLQAYHLLKKQGKQDKATPTRN